MNSGNKRRCLGSYLKEGKSLTPAPLCPPCLCGSNLNHRGTEDTEKGIRKVTMNTTCGKGGGRIGRTLFLLTGLAVLLYWSSDRRIDTSSRVARSYQILEKLETVQLLLQEDESALRGFLLTGKSDYLKSALAAREKLPVAQEALVTLLDTQGIVTPRWDAWQKAGDDEWVLVPKKIAKGLKSLFAERESATQIILDAGKSDVNPAEIAPGTSTGKELLAALENGNEFAQKIVAQVGEIRKIEEKSLEPNLVDIRDSAQFLGEAVVAIHFVYVGFVVVGLILVLVGAACRWQWVRNIWFRSIHLTMILIVVAEAIIQFQCPLTTWERDLKLAANMKAEEGGFIARWMHDVVIQDGTNWQEDQWKFEIAYICFGGLVLLSFWLVPPCRRKKPVCSASPALPPEKAAALPESPKPGG